MAWGSSRRKAYSHPHGARRGAGIEGQGGEKRFCKSQPRTEKPSPLKSSLMWPLVRRLHDVTTRGRRGQGRPGFGSSLCFGQRTPSPLNHGSWRLEGLRLIESPLGTGLGPGRRMRCAEGGRGTALPTDGGRGVRTSPVPLRPACSGSPVQPAPATLKLRQTPWLQPPPLRSFIHSTRLYRFPAL